MNKKYPKIKSVKALRGKKLEVIFADREKRIYDCLPLLREKPFSRLADAGLFKRVRVDPGGYGVSFDDEMDLSESEIWIKGKPA